MIDVDVNEILCRPSDRAAGVTRRRGLDDELWSAGLAAMPLAKGALSARTFEPPVV